MSSALAKSSGAIWHSAAAAFSTTCSGRVAPIIAEDTSCLRNTQASANWVKVTPASRSARIFTCCTAVNRGARNHRFGSMAPIDPWAARDSAGSGAPGLHLPVNTPWASGDQTIWPMPSSAQRGKIFFSGEGRSSEYCG